MTRPSQRSSKIAVAICTGVLLASGLTSAVATSGTTGVAITPLVPAKSIVSATTIGANKVYSFIAAGGSTTVPTNVSAVQLAVTVKSPVGGTLSFAPLGDPANASPTTISWPTGGSNAGSVIVNIGSADKVAITNTSSGSATVGVKITGYSTQVTAASINGSGGNAGQVLTNNGDGTASWQAVPTPPPAQTVLRARVKATAPGATNVASLVAPGDAVSVSNPGVGVWFVQFGRPTAGCAVTATPGNFNDGSSYDLTTWLSVVPSLSQVQVQAYHSVSGSVSPVNTGFNLILVC